MRAVQAKRFGGPEVLEVAEVAEPAAGVGQVVVEVAAVDTLFLETQIRSGAFAEPFGVRTPYVPGGGVAGTVVAVGDGADGAWLGRRVVGSVGVRGGYAEKSVAAESRLVAVPDGLGLREAAALAHDGATAEALLEATGLDAGDTVLILGASGGMGTLLVQLAKAAGAEVVGVARGVEKTGLVKELGADAAVDATAGDWTEAARAALGEGGADVVLDGVGGEMGLAAFGLLADGGRFSAHGAPTGGFAEIDPAEADSRGVKLTGIAEVQLADDAYVRLLARAVAAAAEGRLHPVVGGTFPLERASDAHRAIEERSLRGKVLLTV
ncbi:zinc-binding dehydrogenase [Streptomyces sp. HNM0663]|uniref:Zinc-binding dehydrogenase n=1 Tax=Streptomyces chengmaiensis TaxID=3040919 RepID=A0ABT6HM10_9ACTN|nr:zinc-binding dehydrogenase [Streptomyces chengmaiensis]MDH2389771.1 zinc-binding dehydrogenase [Streptomyces chengmaiensis]